MKNLRKTVMTMVLVLAIINLASAQRSPENSPQHKLKEGQGRAMMQGMKFTEEQQKKMHSMKLSLQKEMLPLRNEIGENRAKLKSLSTAENADMKAINNLIDEDSKLKASIAKLLAANHQEIRKMLTEEQRIIFDSKGFHKSRSHQFKGQKNSNKEGKRGRLQH